MPGNLVHPAPGAPEPETGGRSARWSRSAAHGREHRLGDRRSAVRACVTAVADAIDALALYGLVARLFPERLAAVIQTVMFHTSCSQLIAVGDEFGALEITAGTNVPK